jgi:hypothetical protein
MKFRILAVVVVLGMISAAAVAADISGKWVTEVAGMGGGEPMKIFYNFKVAGTTLTGTTGPEGMDSPISEGKIDGDNISFVVKISMGEMEMKMKMKGKIAGEEIKLKMEMEGGMGGPGGPGGGGPGGGPGGGAPPEMVLKRAK